MSENQPRQPLPVVPIAIGTAVILIGCMLIAFILITTLSPNAPRRATPTPSPTVTPLGQPMFPTATEAADEPTATPTDEPTEEAAEETEEPAEEETEAPTDEPAPTSAPQPTAPPPTNTPEPTAAPASSRLQNVSFTVTNPTVNPDEGIIFNFSFTNPSSTDELPLGIVGVVVFDSAGNNVHFHTSWTGWVMDPGKTENWTDTVAIGTSGSYKLQLSICYSSVEACQGSSGDWELAAPPVDITVR